MRLSVVAFVVAICAAIGAYLYLSYGQPAPVGTAAQAQLPLSPATTTKAAPQQAVAPATTPSVVPATTSQPAATSTVLPDATQHPGMKLYRNADFGFEFWYPEAWMVEENTYGNPGTKFDIVAYPTRPDGKHPYYDPLVVSIVTSDFVNGEYSDLRSSARPTVVDGKKGLRYEYTQDTRYDDIIIPIGADKSVIIGNDDDTYATDFNNILSSFRFLK